MGGWSTVEAEDLTNLALDNRDTIVPDDERMTAFLSRPSTQSLSDPLRSLLCTVWRIKSSLLDSKRRLESIGPGLGALLVAIELASEDYEDSDKVRTKDLNKMYKRNYKIYTDKRAMYDAAQGLGDKGAGELRRIFNLLQKLNQVCMKTLRTEKRIEEGAQRRDPRLSLDYVDDFVDLVSSVRSVRFGRAKEIVSRFHKSYIDFGDRYADFVKGQVRKLKRRIARIHAGSRRPGSSYAEVRANWRKKYGPKRRSS